MNSKSHLTEMISLIDLCEKISNKYDSETAFEDSVRGLRLGLHKYADDYEAKTAKAVKLEAYLSWFIKTAVELGAGIDNEDTRLMASDHNNKNLLKY